MECTRTPESACWNLGGTSAAQKCLKQDVAANQQLGINKIHFFLSRDEYQLFTAEFIWQKVRQEVKLIKFLKQYHERRGFAPTPRTWKPLSSMQPGWSYKSLPWLIRDNHWALRWCISGGRTIRSIHRGGEMSANSFGGGMRTTFRLIKRYKCSGPLILHSCQQSTVDFSASNVNRRQGRLAESKMSFSCSTHVYVYT